MATTYLTTDELSHRVNYDPRTIRERLKDSLVDLVTVPATTEKT